MGQRVLYVIIGRVGMDTSAYRPALRYLCRA